MITAAVEIKEDTLPTGCKSPNLAKDVKVAVLLLQERKLQHLFCPHAVKHIIAQQGAARSSFPLFLKEKNGNPSLCPQRLNIYVKKKYKFHFADDFS
jgi:hypothetical protein